MLQQDKDSLASMKPDERELMRCVVEGGEPEVHITMKRRAYIFAKWYRKHWIVKNQLVPVFTDRGRAVYKAVQNG